MKNKTIVILTVIALLAVLVPSTIFAREETGGSNSTSAKSGVDLPADPIDDTGVPAGTTLGDLNGDGKVNSDDAIRLLMHTQFPNDEAYAISQSIDYTRDGKITSDDAILLLMHTQFPSDDTYKLDPLSSSEGESSSSESSSSETSSIPETSSSSETSSTGETSTSAQETSSKDGSITLPTIIIGKEVPQAEVNID